MGPGEPESASAADRVAAKILGRLELTVDGVAVELRAPKLRVLAAMLVLRANRVVTVEQLLDALWGDDRPASARNTLQTYVSRLRKAVEPDRGRGEPRLLVTRGSGYALLLPPERIDAHRFEALVRLARRPGTGPGEASEILERALALWRGAAACDLDVDAARADAVRLDEARLGATEEWVNAKLELGHHRELVSELQALVRANPLREQLVACLMLALYRSGRQAEALRAYQQLRHELAHAGLQPSAGVTRLDESILLQRPELDWAPAPAPASRTAAPPANAGAPVSPRDQGVASAAPARSPSVVGRDAELAVLRGCLVAASDHGQPSVVLVAGEAGVGKSRLVAELVAVEAPGAGFVVLTGGCGALSGDVPYAAIGEAFRRHLRSLDPAAREELQAVAEGALGRVVPELAPEADDGAWSAPARLYGLLLRTIGWLARASPVLMVLEDLHWADASSYAALEFLARNLTDERVVVVATARSDELHRLHPRHAALAQLELCPLVRRIDVRPLGHHHVEELATGILGPAADPDLLARVAARSRGNPLFVEELIAGHLAGVDLRPTLREMLVSRVERVGATTTTCLRLLAVAARPLTHALLEATSGLPREALTAALRAGVDHHAVVVDDDGHYDFRHALVAEALVADLLPGEREDLHARVAAALAASGDAVSPSEVAHHWLAANDMGRALPALVHAGEVAERSLARAEAVRLYERAAGLWDRVPDAAERVGVDRVELLERAADAALHAGGSLYAGSWTRVNRHAVDLTEAALAGIDVGAEPAHAARLHARLAVLLPGLEESGDEHRATALRLLPADDSPDRAEVLSRCAAGLALAYRYEEAVSLAEEAAGLGRRHGDRLLESRARSTLAVSLGYLGDVAAAREESARSAQLAEADGAGVDVVRAHVALWSVLWVNDRHDEALQLNFEIDGVARHYRLADAVRPGQLIRRAAPLRALGRWRECETILTELDRRWPGAFDRLFERAAIAAARGDEGTYRRAAAEMQAAEVDEQRAYARSIAQCEAELALWQDRPDDAREAARSGLAFVAALGAPELVGPMDLLVIRAEAGLVERARRARAYVGAAEACARIAPHVERLCGFARRPGASPSLKAMALTAQAEAGVIEGAPDAGLWLEATLAWRAAGNVYQLAWAQCRAAEAIAGVERATDRVLGLVAASRQEADRLGLVPLVQRLDGFRRGSPAVAGLGRA